MINYEKELVKEFIECDNPVRSAELMNQIKHSIMFHNSINTIAEFATECLIYQLAVPPIPVSQKQYEAITRMFKVKGLDGRGGDRRSKKYKDLHDNN